MQTEFFPSKPRIKLPIKSSPSALKPDLRSQKKKSTKCKKTPRLIQLKMQRRKKLLRQKISPNSSSIPQRNHFAMQEIKSRLNSALRLKIKSPMPKKPKTEITWIRLRRQPPIFQPNFRK